MSSVSLIRLLHCCLCSIFLYGASAATSQSFSASGGPWLLPEPSSGSGCGNFTGLDIGIPIAVSGVDRRITDVRVAITFAPAATWAGDLSAILTAPNGASTAIVGRIGANLATSCGDSSALSGTYTFVDPNVSSNNIWTAASGVAGGVTIPPGTYMTTPIGGVGGANPPAGIPLISVFANLPAAQINGQWILRLRDSAIGERITVAGVTLTLPVDCYDIDGDGQNNPLLDGLITLRAQLGLSGAGVTGGISFPGNATRTTWSALRAFMVDSCGMMGVAN
ncbi:MAG: hypothetical protein ABIZ64_01705 [Casimicrobium sp.]